MDPITLNLRVGREPPASEPAGGELSAAQIDANFTALRTAAEQLDAEKLGIDEAETLNAIPSAPIGTDLMMVVRGGQAYTATLSQLATYIGAPPAATAPAAFTVGQWTAEPTATPGEISFNITALPSDGGSAITALQYRVGAGAAIAFTGTGTGVRVATAGLTAGSSADLQVRAVNAVDADPDNWGDVKTRTPLAEPTATAPEAFVTGNWTLTPIAGGIRYGITALPANGGSAITALQYTLNAGSTWTSFSAATTGNYDVTGLPETLQTTQIRAVNAVNPGDPSDVKTATPEAAPVPGGVAYIGQTYTPKIGDSTTVARPSGAGAGDTLIVLFYSDSASDATAALPAGWTEVAVVSPGDTPGRVITAAGDVSDMTFSHAASLGGFLCVAVEGSLGASALVGRFWGDNPGANAPAPSITAGAGDTVVSLYVQAGGTAAAFDAPTAGYTRQYVKEDASPFISVLSQADVAAGETGTISHGATNGDYNTRWLFTGAFS